MPCPMPAIDCAESRDGRLLVFEVDSRGLVHAADPLATYPYTAAVMRYAFDALETMLFDRARIEGHKT